MADIPSPGWRERIIDFIREEAKPVEKYGHQPRLYALTKLVGAGLEYDDDVVFAAAWLHDLGVFTGHRPEEPEALSRWDNTAYAMARTPAILEGFGFPPEKIRPVVECIRHHQPTGEPTTIEATILRDADILEQLGAVSVLRTICKVGRDTRFHTFTDAVVSLRKACEVLPGQLLLPSARALAEPRVRILGEFLHFVEVEAGADLH